MKHRSGFVNIIGRPNVGKSTLMNALVGERMSIITHKPQTTRHRIIGIFSGDDFQIVFSDTPGLIGQPAYRMQKAMNRAVQSTFEDADIMLFVTEPAEDYTEGDPLIQRLRESEAPVFVIINKIDKITEGQLKNLDQQFAVLIPKAERFAVSALQKLHTEDLLKKILDALPEGPEYYPKDQLTDRSERFFVSEIIREKILELYQQEIPYSVEAIVTGFKEGETKEGSPIARIEATLFVARKSQKPIIIGKNGQAIKTLGTEARKAIEQFLEMKVHLELTVKVRENWRDDEQMLKQFGYLD
ncbi:MAG: GTPase Era [Saprospirales bacterium]|jgi:GTP-binding protein Era|nr:GTPase Era [Saprospirales bacterium]MBK6903412.1 GTPase Era [Saprospirales bacterium]